MASMGMATIPLNFLHFQSPRISVSCQCSCSCNQFTNHRFMQQNFRLRVVRFRSKSMSAVGSGASVSDPNDNAFFLKDAKITVESRSQNNVQVPKSFLLEIFGEDHVTKFVIQEIVRSTMADYVKKENLNVKDKKINTTQTIEELKNSFTPGNEFGFN